MEQITKAEAGFWSITETIDTTIPTDRTIVQMVGSFTEFEWAML